MCKCLKGRTLICITDREIYITIVSNNVFMRKELRKYFSLGCLMGLYLHLLF